MSATNATTNYNLPLFIGTDKPAWLVDWNSAMTDIDSAIKAVDTDVQGAIVDISGLSSTVASHTSSISTISGQITVITTNLNTATGNINTINSLIGNGTPTTTDQTIIGAINEVNARVQEFGTHLIPFDIESVIASVTADGVKTYSQLLDELFAGFASFIANADDNEYVKFDYLHIDDIGDFAVSYSYVFVNSSNISAEVFDLNKSFTNGTDFFVAHDVSLRASGSSIKYYSNDGTNPSFGTSDNTVPTAGKIIVLKGMTYKMI